jgi:hypothetical protein
MPLLASQALQRTRHSGCHVPWGILKVLENAKAKWTVDHHKTTNDAAIWLDLVGTNHAWPRMGHNVRGVPLGVASVLVALLACGCTSTSTSRNTESNRAPALRRELLAMVDTDQRVREGIRLPMTSADIARMQEVDARHTARMKQILATHRWPGRSLVGEDGAHAAWLLVQHSDDQFMAYCLPLMEQAVLTGEASRRDYVYLLDRVRMKQGKPQVYGTQFISGADGMPVLYPIEDAEHVDERRRAIGLPSMAEYERKIREVYK